MPRSRASAKTVFVLQHSPCETLGVIAEALASVGCVVRTIRSYAGKPIPATLGEATGLIVMGGPMGVYESARYPFLLEEMRLIDEALRAGTPILGVCLGSQLLAATLGAQVIRAAAKEIGWHPVTLAPAATWDRLWSGVEPNFVAFHWHGDIFELPQGAVALASSAATACQAFRYSEQAYGLLFHLEVTQEMIDQMVNTFAGELREARVEADRVIRETQVHLSDLHRVGHVVFNRWTGLLEKGQC